MDIVIMNTEHYLAILMQAQEEELVSLQIHPDKYVVTKSKIIFS